MFPNPQGALPLVPNPTVEHYTRLTKDLLGAAKAYRQGDPLAIGRWAEKWLEGLARLFTTRKRLKPARPALDRKIDEVEEFATRQLADDKATLRLSDAQFVIASSHGFDSWSQFVKHVRALSQRSSLTAKFEAAVEAIINGDLKSLKRLLHERPELISTRSSRRHHATLLHYVSANGVEGYRQKTPKNIVKIAETLLAAGADVNAEADVYGGGATTLGLVGTSVHPFRAGVQNPLMQLLIDHGADIDHQTSAGNKQNAVLGCLANGRGEAAIYLAEHGARLTLESAAGIGQLDVVKSFFNETGKLKSRVRKKELVSALLFACCWGKNNVVQFLIEKGVSLTAHRGDGQTAMHWAAIGGQLETIKLLLKSKPPLEARNTYGGTVLGQTLWSAAHGGDPEVFSRIIEILIESGAKLRERHTPVNKQIDDLLRRYGSEPEASWYWFGEKPREYKS